MRVDDIIARLEGAAGKSAELNTLIHESLRGKLGKLERARNYTGNLQDAVSLVPDGWLYSVGNDGREYGHGWARVFPPEGQHKGAGNQHGATAPLALCIAALKARL